MLNDEQRQFIKDNMNIVYGFCHHYNIKDDDDIADLMCEFCRIIDKNTYDVSKGAITTFIWTSLSYYNYTKKCYKTAQCRTLQDGDTMVYLNETLKKGVNETEISELVTVDDDCFGESEAEIIIAMMRRKCKEIDKKARNNRVFTNEELFDELLWYYHNRNGLVNCAEIAKRYSVSRQAVNSHIHELAKRLKMEFRYDEWTK